MDEQKNEMRRPAYEDWRSRGCCTSNSSHAAGSQLLGNAPLLSYLYPPRSLAIATVHTVGAAQSAGCGLLKWCFSAVAFSRHELLRNAAEVVVLTNNATWARSECRTPGVRFIAADTTLQGLMSDWGAIKKPGQSGKRSRPSRPVTLMKWQLFALTQYRAVFYSDIDVIRRPVDPTHIHDAPV